MNVVDCGFEHRCYAKVTSQAAQAESLERWLGDKVAQKYKFADADVVYALEITATGATDAATLTLASGAVVRDTATPDVTRWTGQTSDLAGEDFEGIALPTMVTLYQLEILLPEANTAGVAIACSDLDLPDVGSAKGGLALALAYTAGETAVGTVGFTFAATGDKATLFVAGKTT